MVAQGVPGQSVMMARRAWSLASDPAGAATAMTTPRAMPALLPPPARPWQATQQPSERTLPTPWVLPGEEIIADLEAERMLANGLSAVRADLLAHPGLT